MGGSGVGVAGQVLHVLKRHVLGKQVGHHQDAEAVGAEDEGQPGILEPPLEHETHGVGRQGPVGELFLFPHKKPRREGGTDDESNLQPAWPDEHERLDRHRHTGYDVTRVTGEN